MEKSSGQGQLILFAETPRLTINDREKIMVISQGWVILKDGIYSHWNFLRKEALAEHLALRYREYEKKTHTKSLCDALWKRSKRKGYSIVKVRRIFLGPDSQNAIQEVYDWVHGIGKGGKVRRGPYDSHIPHRVLGPSLRADRGE